MKNNNTISTQEEQMTVNEIKLLNYVRRVDNLGESIRKVLDHAIYFSSEDIDKELLKDLYSVRLLEDYIEEIEQDQERNEGGEV